MSSSSARRGSTPSLLEFHTLLALSAGASYGYGIQQEILRATEGDVNPTVGALYRVLARFMERGLVEEHPAPDAAPDATPGHPRRYYGLTRAGRRALAEEAARLQTAVSLARARDVLA